MSALGVNRAEVPFALAAVSSERVSPMRLVVIGAVIAVLGFAMSLGGFAWGLTGGEWWPGPTLLNGFGWLVLGAGVALAIVGLVRRSRSRAGA